MLSNRLCKNGGILIMISREAHKKPLFDKYIFGVLIALEVLMSFTFLGYIHIPPLSITTAYIPILIAGCLLGPVQSMTVGFVFGIASMYKASATYVMPSDMVFSPFLSGSPMPSIILSVGTRTLFGLLVGLAFFCARKSKHYRWWIAVIAALASKLHAILVYSAMGAFFPQLGYNYTKTFCFGMKELILTILCVGITELLWQVYNSRTVREFKYCVDRSNNNPYIETEKKYLFGTVSVFLAVMSVFATVYFSQRASYMLTRHDVEVTAAIQNDLIHLQVQFLMAMLALIMILLILMLAMDKYMSYREYLGELDGLTNVMGRRMFLNYCGKLQSSYEELAHDTGWFLLVDVDKFKGINDTFGHLAGDTVLKEVADALKHHFLEYGVVGRIGGDEFAVILEKEMSEETMKAELDGFLEQVAEILPEQKIKASCSIGALRFKYPEDMTNLMAKTDTALYEAKDKGRACYIIK